MDRNAAAALDRWITRGPYSEYDGEPVVYRCGCGRFLRHEPTYTFEYSAIGFCDGKPTVVDDAYHDPQVIAILGEEFRGKPFKVAYAPDCASKTGKPDDWHRDDGEISETEVDAYTHEPHAFESAFGSTRVDVRVCWCGKENHDLCS